ncbi:hypothetical protein P0Y35_11850 [Kiritimatiellaeota bacterium B1221]|nr:hypothetical protein [Kiritimatiellaeota bacterium B1221]
MSTDSKDKLSGKQWLGILSAISITTALSWVASVGAYKEKIEAQAIEITVVKEDIKKMKEDRFRAYEGELLKQKVEANAKDVTILKATTPYITERLDTMDSKIDKQGEKIDAQNELLLKINGRLEARDNLGYQGR